MLLPAPSSKPAESPFAKHQNQNAFTIAVYKFERTEAVKARGPTLSVQEICQLNALILPSFSTYWKEMERVTAHRYAPDIERKLLLTVWNDCTLRASAHVEDWGTMKRKWEAEMQKFIFNTHLWRTFGDAAPYDYAWGLGFSAEHKLVDEFWPTESTAVKDIERQDLWQAPDILERLRKGQHVEESKAVKDVSRKIRFMNWYYRHIHGDAHFQSNNIEKIEGEKLRLWHVIAKFEPGEQEHIWAEYDRVAAKQHHQ